MEFNKKEVMKFLLIGLILSVLILCLPVSGASWEDVTRMMGGTSNPTSYYIWGNSTIPHTILMTTGSDAADLNRYGYCCDHSVQGELTLNVPPYSAIAGCEVALSTLSKTDAGNGTTFGQLSANFLPDGGSPYGGYCVEGGFYGIEGYKSMAAYGGDFTKVSVTEYEIRPPSYSSSGAVDFTSDVVSGSAPLTVNFQDTSSFAPTMVNYWDYGDGNTYTAPSTYMTTAQHIYTSAGWYDVKHLAFDLSAHYGWENKTSYIEVLSSGNGTVSGYTMYVLPETVIYNSNFTITTTSVNSKFDGITNIKFGYTKGSESNILDSADGNILDYVNTSGTWYQYNVNNHLYDIPLSGVPSSIINIPAKMGSGTYTIDGYITKTTGQVIHLTDSLIITTDNQQTLTIQAIDFNDGYVVSGAHINVLNLASNIWTNQTTGGEKIFYYPYSQKIYIAIDASNYISSYKNYTVTNSPNNFIQLVMYRGINTPASNVTMRINVMNNLGAYINTAKVSVLNDESYFQGETKYTNYAGIATFTVLPNTDYAVSVSKSGYLSAGDLINSGAGGNTIDRTFILIEGINPTSTPTPISTVTGSYSGGVGTGTNITPTSCKLTLPMDATIVDTILNNIACAGVKSGANQGYVLAGMIIFVFSCIGAKSAKGVGVMIGAGTGFILSLGMGLVPLWIFVAMLIMFGLVIAIKIWGSDK